MKNQRASDFRIDLQGAGTRGRPFESVSDALTAMVDLLNLYVPFQLWMVTRVDGEAWTVLHANDNGYGVSSGHVFCWSDSLCSRMVRGEGPHYAEDVQCVAEYADAPILKKLPFSAYVGQPLIRNDGSLIGTLCAINPNTVPVLTQEQRTLVETVTRAMSTLLSTYLDAEEARQLAAISQKEAETDALTKLGNRRAWDAALASEEGALRSLGQNAMVMVIDLDGLKETNDTLGHDAGDAMLRKAGKILRQHFRGKDVVCRLGGDEFGVLVRGVTENSAPEIRSRICAALSAGYVPASVGCAMRLAHRTLQDAVKAADAAMYEDKQARKSVRA
jgi:diguanylate cyclase